MLKEFNLQTFFRYFIPGSITLGFIYYLIQFVNSKGYSVPGIDTIEIGQGAVLLGLTFLIGYLVSSLYHYIINFPGLRKFMRMNHIDFFSRASEHKLVVLRGIGESSANLKADRLSTAGSASLFDVYFYRLRRSIDEATDERRFEGFFDVWNGLGSTLSGTLVAYIFWASLPSTAIKENQNDMLWLPLVFFLLGALNWIQLRRWSRSYVESWFLTVLEIYREKHSTPLIVYVRDEHLKPLKNFREELDMGFWQAFKKVFNHILHH